MLQALVLGLDGTAAGTLALMCYQDWQARSISWPAFPVLGGALLALHLLTQSLAWVGTQLALNWAFLLVLLGLLSLYVRLRFRHTGLRLWHCLGSGDVLYWAVVATYFSLPGFLLYFLASSVVALLVAGLVWWQSPQPIGAFRLPLAGVQAGCLLLLLGGQWAFPAQLAQVAAANPLLALVSW